MFGLELLDWQRVIVQLVVATICGGLIGYQRESVERPAGFRTHILVCVGSAVYMLVSVAVAGDRFDPGRIAAQVASGIGFLGAGTIIKQGSIVRGLTTAASLWAVAGIGLAAGYGGPAMGVAFAGTAIVFLALTFLSGIERRMERGRRGFVVEITLEQPRLRLSEIRRIVEKYALEIDRFAVAGEADAKGVIVVEGRTPGQLALEQFIGDVLEIPGVMNIERQYR